MQHPNWEDIRAFIAVAQTGQIGKASVLLRQDATTVARKLKRLEARLGVALFERQRTGQELTEAGEALLAKAETMAAAAEEIGDDASASHGVAGNLRLSVAEGFGSQFLARHLRTLAMQHPKLVIDLVANSGFLNPSRREADLSVMLSRPRTGPVICQKLADYQLRLYAAKSYIASHPPISTPAHLSDGHTLISYVPDLVFAPELNYLEELSPGLRAQIRSSSINAQHRMVAEGVGIAVLPCFIGDRDQALETVCSDHSILRTFWIVTHRDTHNLARVRVARQWLFDSVFAAPQELVAPEGR
jgi:DNA-binding transcriptional LysR family regulator